MVQTNNVPNESSYELRDNQGNLIFSKSGMSPNTLYKDTFDLEPGCYKFQILDTGGSQGWNEDGLSWWANNDGSGYARLREVPGGFFKYYQADFGTELTDYFRVGEYNVVLSEQIKQPILEIYPNPINSILNLDLEFLNSSDLEILITDYAGKIIEVKRFYGFLTGVIKLDLKDIPNGLYNCSIITKDAVYNKNFVVLR